MDVIVSLNIDTPSPRASIERSIFAEIKNFLLLRPSLARFENSFANFSNSSIVINVEGGSKPKRVNAFLLTHKAEAPMLHGYKYCSLKPVSGFTSVRSSLIAGHVVL